MNASLLFKCDKFILMMHTEMKPNLQCLCIMLPHKGKMPVHALAWYTTLVENIFASAMQLQLNYQ